MVDEDHYIGWTDDLDDRIGKHNEGLVKATALRRPFQLVYFEACLNKEKAIAREKYFKTGSGIAILNKRILQLESPG